MSKQYTTLENLETLFRPLRENETEKALALIPVVEDYIRQEAILVGKNIDDMLENGEVLQNVFISVVCDVVGRTLMTSTDSEPMTQYSQSALGYTMSGTFLVPGGGVWLKKTERARLGLRRPKYGGIELYA